MSTANVTTAPVSHADRFFIGGEWVAPSSDATIDVIDSGNRRAVLHDRGGQPRRHVSRGRGRAAGVRRGPVAATDPRGACRVHPRPRRRDSRSATTCSASCGRARSGVLYKTSQYAGRIGAGALASVRRAGRHVPVRGGVPADGRRGVRPARARAGRRRRRDHPVERAGGADLPQDRPGAPRRAARSCSSRRPRRRARATCSPRSPSRSACRPACSTSSPPTARCRSCSSGPGRRQDHLHGIDRRRVGASRRCAASGSRAARSSSAGSRRP